MRTACTFLIPLLLLSFSCTSGQKGEKREAPEIKPVPASTAQWPCPGGSFIGDNFTAMKSPANPELLWEIELPGADATPPLVANNHTAVYVGTSGSLKCVLVDGTESWSVAVKTHIKAPPVIGSDGNIIVAYGETVSIITPQGEILSTAEISKYATHHPTVDAAGLINIYCMEPIDLSLLAPGIPENISPQSTFRGHIYTFDYGLKNEKHVETGIVNCPLRTYDDGVIYGPKLFDRWRTDQPADPYTSKTVLCLPGETNEVTVTEVEHGVIDLFTDSAGIIHFFAHREHLPLPEERNAPLNEQGYVYRVILYSYDPATNTLVKEHWPWMTPEEEVQGTYQEFRAHFNRVRFVYNAARRDAYANAFVEHEEETHVCEHVPGDDVREEVREFVKGCRHMVMTLDGRIIGGTDSIRCYDVAQNRTIWEIEGDPSTIALTDNALLLCIERHPDEDKCILKCFRDKG